MEAAKAKKQFVVPHSLVIIAAVMIIAAILTYVIPAGVFDRVENAAGQTVVDPNSFHYIENSPVNPLTIFSYVYQGLNNSRGIIFSLLCGGGGFGVILATGVFQAAAGTLARKAKGKEWMVVAFIMTVFALLCIPINLNSFIPFAPLGLVIAQALGMDAIVGVSLIMLGGAVGFSCGAMNLSNTGTAQTIAELPIFSGMWYRLVCMIPFLLIAIIYVVRYGNKIKEDPTKSYVYGVDLGSNTNTDAVPNFTKKDILPAIASAAGIGCLIYMAITGTLSNETSSTVYIYLAIIVGLCAKMSLNEICKHFMNGLKGMAGTSMMIGFAYAITIILQNGNIMDTIVHALASVLGYFPFVLQAPAMFIMHICINLLITSGSGQAAASMPIMVPVADLCGITRQTAVLAFNFGDGFCNNILPHAAATMGFVGALNIPFGRWFQYMIKLFALWVIIGCIMLMIASVIGYM